jgi:hypothetical protein
LYLGGCGISSLTSYSITNLYMFTNKQQEEQNPY